MTTPFELELVGDLDLAWLRFERNDDGRGWLSEVFNQGVATEFGLPVFGQDNVSYSACIGLVRGLHFQRPPHAQGKLFRVTQGRIFNVVVDLRPKRFGTVHACEMSPDLGAWLYIPAGFAHGLQTLENEVSLHYKVSRGYAPEALGAVSFDDPELGISWPLPYSRSRLSARDQAAGSLQDARQFFLSFT